MIQKAMRFAVFIQALLVIFPAVAQTNDCKYGPTCSTCPEWTRAYAIVRPYCVVCMSFCPLHKASLSSAGAGTAAGSEPIPATSRLDAEGAFTAQGDPFVVKVPAALIGSVGCTNPEAAMMLKILAERSVSMVNPDVGEGHALKLITCQSLFASLKDPSADITSSMAPLPLENAKFSVVMWRLQKADGSSGVLHLKHRLQDDHYQDLSAIYRDIDVELSFVRKGNARYWNATSWKIAE